VFDLGSLPSPDDIQDGIAVRWHGSIVEVILCRPHVRNALDLAGWHRLAAVFNELSAQPDNIVIVLRGAGGNLSVGSDIRQFPKHRSGMASADVYNGAIDAALVAVGEAAHPVLAVITGSAVGGGCELACASDLRIAADDAQFGVPIARLGVSIGPVEARILLRVLTPARLKDLLLTARMLDAQHALDIGLVDRVIPSAELGQAAWELATTVANAAPVGARANKLTVNAAADGTLDQAASRIRELTVAIYEGSDLQEGIKAFVEKRPAQFGQLQPVAG
jgi:enoyl-CoA hydratase